MKNRLLEDIGDSQAAPSAQAVRQVRPAAPPPVPPDPPAPPEAAPQARARAAVWRSRETMPPLRAADPVVPQTPAPPEPPEPPVTPAPPRAAGIPPWPASFSSREPDWPIPPPSEPAPWLDRWGRKALGWTVAAAAVVAVAGAATWMYRETQVQSTLAVVAGNSPAKTKADMPQAAAAPPLADAAPAWTPPPMRMLPPAPVAVAPVVEAPVVAAAPVEQAPTRAESPLATAPRAPAPKVKRTPELRVAAAPARKKPERKIAAAPPKKAPAAPDLSWAARERERLLAQTQAPAARTLARPSPRPEQPEAAPPQGQQAGAEGPLSETLRLCRAAGYHAAACMKRGCEATRFGLVCRG